jgi:N-acyl-L-homoserine lactone synthetase
MKNQLYLTPSSVNFQQAITDELEQTLKSAVAFAHTLTWYDELPGVYLAKTPEELMEVFSLRSKIYNLHYSSEFPDPIEGLNFDDYDRHSAILYTKNEQGTITGTCRVIFDLNNQLPIDTNYSLEKIRKQIKKTAEISRLVIANDRGLGQESKLLANGFYRILKENGIQEAVSVISDEHYRLYSKFGGLERIETLTHYGSLNKCYVITRWDITQISKFFKTRFLQIPQIPQAA